MNNSHSRSFAPTWGEEQKSKGATWTATGGQGSYAFTSLDIGTQYIIKSKGQKNGRKVVLLDRWTYDEEKHGDTRYDPQGFFYNGARVRYLDTGKVDRIEWAKLAPLPTEA
ncbi:hypothetical protein [Leptolyngbya sp. FACHB-261]|uniref:hypothetical protein n=1 Tax=Leptolyngbya sp. FACHB-261 TaxID=2692806 RepID=UPI001689350F|nr:hypothetical protein [Leptolyngbya sp. FACHB-261]MBD2102606.1 hypothetical protein [Leptolyngbya sp. FACHB-261]